MIFKAFGPAYSVINVNSNTTMYARRKEGLPSASGTIGDLFAGITAFFSSIISRF